MSWLQVGCPRCPTMLNVPATMSGQLVVCPTCGLAYQVPQVQAAAPASPPQAAPPYAAAPYPAAPYVPQPAYFAPPPPAYGMPPGAMTPHVPQAPVGAMPQPVPAVDYPPLLPTTTHPAAPAYATPPAALPPVEVLAPPPTSGTAKPEKQKPKWQHEKRPKPEKNRTPQPEESPTAHLPPAVVKGLRETAAPTVPADADFPKSSPAAPRPPHEGHGSPTGEPLRRDERIFPGSHEAPVAAVPGAPLGAIGRDELSSVEARLHQARRKALVTMLTAAFGIVMMIVFAWFVVNLSRPQ